MSDSTTADFAQDVLGGVAYLQSRPDIDARHVGLLGHSEGGSVAPLAAAGSRDVAFVVLLAAPGVPGSQVVLRQTQQLLAAEGTPEAQIAIENGLLTRYFEILASEPDAEQAAAQIRETFASTKAELLRGNPDAALLAAIAQEEASLPQTIAELTSPWFRYFLQYDPAPALRQLRAPVLALNGTRDLQVDATINLPAIAAALRAGHNPSFTLRALPGLNHLFQQATTGLPSEYAELEQTFDPDALQLIGDWILRQVRSRR